MQKNLTFIKLLIKNISDAKYYKPSVNLLHMKTKKISAIISALIILLIALSAVLAYTTFTTTGFCLINTNENFGSCNTVQNSEYGKILGIKVAYFGLLAFVALLALRVLSLGNWRYKQNAHEIYFIAIILGTLFAFYFIYLQLFVIKSICSTCIVLDATMLLVALLSLIELKQKRSHS